MRRKSYTKKNPHTLLKFIVGIFVVGSILGGFIYIRPQISIPSVPTDAESSLISKLGTYARSFITSDTGISQYVKSLVGEGIETQPFEPGTNSSKENEVLIGKVAVVSDSHASVDTFSEVIKRIRSEDVDMILHLGDVSIGGEIDQFMGIKNVLDESGIPYYVLPGDHDYNWVPQYDLQNFTRVFNEVSVSGSARLIEYMGMSFVLFDNSGKDTDSTVIEPLIDLLESLPENSPVYLFTVSPFTNPYFETKQDSQGEAVLEKLSKYPIRQIFSGDTHIFSRYTDEETNVTTTTVGATGDYKNPLPQYVIVEFFDNGEFEIKSKPAVDLESGD
ncbi:metallophosphoesterase [candidate division WWE3 bacterium]|uniref:Metallophosphoesterase n=1 Tax=candidate division WWE3 bacterium TaxID=2053526 RepID=A0A955LX41_UNCKA|nr:metallophosphoesterase [candidate division WWE3 bacterium]